MAISERPWSGEDDRVARRTENDALKIISSERDAGSEVFHFSLDEAYGTRAELVRVVW